MTDVLKLNCSRHIAFSGGGSGGHLTPAIAVAEKLLADYSDVQVTFLTSGREIDRDVMHHASISIEDRCTTVHLPVTQPPDFGWSGRSHARDLWKSVLRSYRVLKRRKINAMLATGAFASVPGLLAAKWLRIPSMLFEANVRSGRVNRWWKRRATMALSAWPTMAIEGANEYRSIGMPVRSEVWIPEADQAASPEIRRPQILVVGGSQGSRRVNDLLEQVLMRLALPDHWQVLHQIGSDHQSVMQREINSHVRTVGFIADIGLELRRSAFVISRAGAVTLGEIAATGCPSILVPLSTAAERHQQRNAEYFVEQRAAILVDESSPRAVDELVHAVNHLIRSETDRLAMSQAAQSIHRPGAADEIARLLIELADGRERHD